MRRWTTGLLALLVALSFSASAFAQGGGASSTGTIQGRVADAQGAVLPGVTVTATSPALLGAQTTVTSETGNYRFPAVPPGTYELTYELAGFNTLKREGISITLGFTAKVNVELALATLQETVTVTGESPVIDTSTTRIQQNFKMEQLQSLPNARDMWALLAVTPSVQMGRIDVGGNRAGTQTGYAAYGMTGQVRVLIEGINTTEGTGGAGFYFDYASLEEAFLGTSGQSAEMPNPGVQSQFIARSGSTSSRANITSTGTTTRSRARTCPTRTSRRRRSTTARSATAQRDRSLLRPRHQRRWPDQAGQGLVLRHLSRTVQRGGAAELPVRQDLRHQAVERGRQGQLPGQPEQQVHRLLPVGPEDAAQPPAVSDLYLYVAGADLHCRIRAAGFTRVSGTAPSATRCISKRATATSATTSRSLTNSPDDYFFRDTGRWISIGAHQKQQLDRDRKQYTFAATYFLDTAKGSHTFKMGGELLKEQSWEGSSRAAAATATSSRSTATASRPR